MPTSMTGFGRSLYNAPFGKIVVEIQAVNRKYLEIFVSLPKEYSRFELEVRKWVGEHVARGQITVRIFVTPPLEGGASALPDLGRLKALKREWEEIAEELGYDRSSVNFSFLTSRLPAAVSQETVDEDAEPFKKCTVEALLALAKMKQKEGEALSCDMELRLHGMEKVVAQIETLAPETVLKMKKRLQERIAEAVPALLEGDERILKEVAIFAEKIDVTEEITRLRSHFSQFHHLLQEKGAIGRKMDFLVQEMGREINTIGSKSLESKIAHLVVEVKSELEKVREQIQNIE